MSRRASLPGADELFRRTTPDKAEARKAAPAPEPAPKVDKSTKPQIASVTAVPTKAPKHDEKITFYCTSDDLMAIEQTRLELRAKHGTAADRGIRRSPNGAGDLGIAGRPEPDEHLDEL